MIIVGYYRNCASRILTMRWLDFPSPNGLSLGVGMGDGTFSACSVWRNILASSVSTSYPIIKQLAYKRCICLCQDDFAVLPGIDHEVVAVFEQALVALSDHVVVVTEALYEKWGSADPIRIS